jgi:uncharacterized protein
MPEYLSPGVYVEEVDAGPKPIAAVSTSTAGMVGVTERGPTTGKPRLVTSFAEFTRVFGGFTAPPDANIVNQWIANAAEGGRWWWFPLSVKGFFDNGGQRLFVKRVFAAAATPGTAVLGQGLVADVVADAAANTSRLRLDHLFGIATGSTITVFNGETGSQIGGNFNVDAYDPTTSRVTVSPNLPAEVIDGRGDFVQIFARSASPVPAAEVTLEFETSSRGGWGNDYSVETSPVAELTLNLLPDPAVGGAAPVTTIVSATPPAAPGQPYTLQVADATGIANGDHVLVAGRWEQVVANLNAANDTFEITPGIPPGEVLQPGTIVKRLRAANAAGDTTINVAGASRLYEGALVEFDNGTDKERTTVDSIAGDTVTLASGLAQVYFEGHRVRAIGISVRVIDPSGDVAESFGPLRLRNDGTTNFVVTNVNTLSELVRVRTRAGFSDSDLSNFPTGTGGPSTPFSGGDDRLDALTPEDFVGVDAGSGNRTGVLAFEDVDEVSICAAPGVWSATVRSALITHCEILKDRFAIVDPQDRLSIERIRAFKEPIDTKYGALYYPWIEVRDPLSRRDVGVAPSGHMAGIYARTDVERGVHKAPANVVMRGITRFQQDVTKREQDLLNPIGINALRAFPNLGMRVWGARTLSSDQSWKYINVRRLFLMVEESIDEGTQWVVFEPNDERLWARVRQSVSNFLLTVWRDGALAGTTPDEAFFVTCDLTTMTPTDIENGRLICEIGIAPVFPAEFVIFRIQQKTREAVAA